LEQLVVAVLLPAPCARDYYGDAMRGGDVLLQLLLQLQVRAAIEKYFFSLFISFFY
jgi:hypothetical protein